VLQLDLNAKVAITRPVCSNKIAAFKNLHYLAYRVWLQRAARSP
jgi:hypothetical protein